MMMRSIWFWVLPSGDVHVSLWISLCANRVPPMIKSFCWQKLTNLSPLLVITSTQCIPMVIFLSLLSQQTLALKSPSNISTCVGGCPLKHFEERRRMHPCPLRLRRLLHI
ncbi:hypothetical protein DPMN_036966 [Dreissena polymorpha]|uniref:Uncharacterized protein n=1 Tax=Dreissena polymorpha TaxID=45954 RepID=A0A9D4MDK0_DREPO|nr:hypothetical protein DPMN_036966 [Dreissena polymorpha]